MSCLCLSEENAMLAEIRSWLCVSATTSCNLICFIGVLLSIGGMRGISTLLYIIWEAHTRCGKGLKKKCTTAQGQCGANPKKKKKKNVVCVCVKTSTKC